MPEIYGWSEDNVSLTALRDLRNQPSDGIDVIDRMMCSTNSTFAVVVGTSGTFRGTYFTPTRTVTVSQIATATSTTAAVYTSATGVVARMGLFTANASTGALTLVARTASDTTLWIATTTVYTRSFDTTGGYPSSYTLQAGTRYCAGLVVYASGGTITSPLIVSGALSISAMQALSPQITALVNTGANSQDLPTSVTPSAGGGAPWFRLSA